MPPLVQQPLASRGCSPPAAEAPHKQQQQQQQHSCVMGLARQPATHAVTLQVMSAQLELTPAR
jgi:hypothetical protein